jgi:hypothetical protein
MRLPCGPISRSAGCPRRIAIALMREGWSMKRLSVSALVLAVAAVAGLVASKPFAATGAEGEDHRSMALRFPPDIDSGKSSCRHGKRAALTS